MSKELEYIIQKPKDLHKTSLHISQCPPMIETKGK